MQELYKRYRPKTLDRVVGNEQTVASLLGMIEKGKLPHTILFHGPSGCGKTTLARIVKDALGATISTTRKSTRPASVASTPCGTFSGR